MEHITRLDQSRSAHPVDLSNENQSVRVLRDCHRVPGCQYGRCVDQKHLAPPVKCRQGLRRGARQQELARIRWSFAGTQDLQHSAVGVGSPVHLDDVEGIRQLGPRCDTGEPEVAQAEEPVDAGVPQIEVDEDDVTA